MNRSIAFAATSLSALLLVTATWATPVFADESGRGIEVIDKKKFKTLTTITPDVDTQAKVVQPPEKDGKTPDLLLSTSEEDKPILDAPVVEASPDAVVNPKNSDISTVEEDKPEADPPIQATTSEPPVKPKAFTIDKVQEPAPPPVEEAVEVTDEAPPPPKEPQPKVVEAPAEGEEIAEPKPVLIPKTQVDAATSDEIDDEAEPGVATQKIEEKPVEETAVTADDKIAPTYKKKVRMHYSPSLRRYVETTDEDVGDDNTGDEDFGEENLGNNGSEANEHYEDGYEVPSNHHGSNNGYGSIRDNNDDLPSCKN